MFCAHSETLLQLLGTDVEFIEFSKFREKNFPAKKFRISFPADIGHKIVLLTFFHVYYDPNPIISNKT